MSQQLDIFAVLDSAPTPARALDLRRVIQAEAPADGLPTDRDALWAIFRAECEAEDREVFSYMVATQDILRTLRNGNPSPEYRKALQREMDRVTTLWDGFNKRESDANRRRWRHGFDSYEDYVCPFVFYPIWSGRPCLTEPALSLPPDELSAGRGEDRRGLFENEDEKIEDADND